VAYDNKVLDHYKNPRNVGSLDKNDPNVGTGVVGAPECGDVMKLQIKVSEVIVAHRHMCMDCPHSWTEKLVGGKCLNCSTCPACNGHNRIIENIFGEVIEEAKFKTFGCGSAIASSSLATEWLKGRTIDEAAKIKNTDIVQELALPPIKIHCSVLAEDAIKAALDNWKRKQASRSPPNTSDSGNAAKQDDTPPAPESKKGK